MDTNRKKTILDFLTIDISTFFNQNYIEVGTEDTPAIQVVDYELKLDNKELDIFDTIRLRVLFDKNNIEGETHINASFRCKKRRTNKEDAINLVNKMASFFSEDNNGNKYWDENDDINYENGTFNRVWATGIGENFVSIFHKEITGLELNILFLNNLLKHIGSRMEFN